MSGKTFVKRRGTTAVPNATVHDTALSYTALGVLVVALGRKASRAGNGYRSFTGRREGQAAILRAFGELEAAGYRHQFRRRQGGKFVTDTVWCEEPISPDRAAAWWSKMTGQTAPGAPTKGPAETPETESTVRENPRTDHALESTHGTVREKPCVKKHRISLQESKSLITPTSYKRPDNPNSTAAEPVCVKCDRAKTADQLTASGICPDCLEPAPHTPAPGSGYEAFKRAQAELKAYNAEHGIKPAGRGARMRPAHTGSIPRPAEVPSGSTPANDDSRSAVRA